MNAITKDITDYKLFSLFKTKSLNLKNRVVMAPMTRSRAIGNIPNALMATYYLQRAGAGLIITEGTAPSPNGLGYARIPGIFNDKQVEGWKKTTTAVHEAGSKIFVQLMHTGRISHALNMPTETEILAPSAVKPAGQMWTDAKQLQDFDTPKAMTALDIVNTKAEYVIAAKNALTAGFDGVELHAANGYLLEEFLSPHTNLRTDDYGGSIEKRSRFLLEVVADVAKEIGKAHVGIRLSPYGTASDMHYYEEVPETYNYLSAQLNTLDIAYIHVADHSAMGSPKVPEEIKKAIRNNFKNSLILCGGYDKARAEADLQRDFCDLIAFGRPFINNPDLVARLQNNWPISDQPDANLFYTAGEKGYSDYPNHIIKSVL
jgi:N-ethylmaleimide reductase